MKTEVKEDKNLQILNNAQNFISKKFAINEEYKTKNIGIKDVYIIRCFFKSDLELGAIFAVRKNNKFYTLNGEIINYDGIFMDRKLESGFTKFINNWQDNTTKQKTSKYISEDLLNFQRNEILKETSKIVVESLLCDDKETFSLLKVQTNKLNKLELISAYKKVIGYEMKYILNRRKDFTNIYDLKSLELLYNKLVAENFIKQLNKDILSKQYLEELIK